MFGFMFTAMILSMWIRNTATTTMMIPIVEAVLEQIQDHLVEDGEMKEGDEEYNVEAVKLNSPGLLKL